MILTLDGSSLIKSDESDLAHGEGIFLDLQISSAPATTSFLATSPDFSDLNDEDDKQNQTVLIADSVAYY